MFGNIGMVKRCRKIAEAAHAGQTRKLGADEGKPYIIHPGRVAAKFKKDTHVMESVAWLHDVVEDTNLTFEALLDLRVTEPIVNLVKILTRIDDEDYLDYIIRVSENELATEVKIADLEDNLQSIHRCSLRDKYMLAMYILKNKWNK